MAKTKMTSLRTKPDKVVERNILLTGEFMHYLLARPHIFDSLPDEFELVILPQDDPELSMYNIKLLDAFTNEGKPVVIVRMKPSQNIDFQRTQPDLYVPLAFA
ncbi:MAG: DUF5647 family protein [Chloroflexota bacterium]